MKTLLIVDDHPLFREGLKSIIGRIRGFQVVAEAGKGDEALRLAREHKPDLATVDISLPDWSGIDLTRELLRMLPESRVLIITIHSTIDYVTAAFQAGATGYMVKESASEILLPALKSVADGEHFLDKALSHEVVKRLLRTSISTAPAAGARYGTLTRREQEVLRLLAEGLSTREVAERLCISPKTVENHRAHIMEKLGTRNTVELVRCAAKLGLIDLQVWRD